MIFPLLLILTIASRLSSGCHFGRSYRYVFTKRLSISCPRVQRTHVASPGRDSVVVRWRSPTVRGSSGKVEQIGKSSGSSFSEGSHTIRYVTRDSHNRRKSCEINFNVKVSRCPLLRDPINGKLSCTGNKYGDICTASCLKGHSLTGSSRITCLSSNRWNHNVPTCHAKTCGTLKPPKNALPFKCDKGHNSGRVCVLQCDKNKGFTEGKVKVTRCDSRGKWSEEQFECKDIEVPRFLNCPSQTIHQSADPQNNLTSVVWPKVKVTDNSMRVKTLKSPRGVTMVGGMFPVGTHIVKIRLLDEAGNEAEPCSFVVQIERKECEPPKLEDRYIRTPGCVPPFVEGDQCKVLCSMDIPLVGSKYITCRTSADGQSGAFWDWGQKNRPPKPKPYCQVPKCQPLAPPSHGAMACDKWLGGQMCQVMCQKGFDVPGEFEKYYICPINSGKWNNDNVTPCQTAIPGWGQTLTAAYIYSGPCSSVKEEVKTNFINMLTSNDLCKGQHCKVDNVKVTCGKERKKRNLEQAFDRVRRGAAVHFIVFELTIKSQVTVGLSSDQIANATTDTLMQVMNEIKKSGFTVGGKKVSTVAVRNKPPVPVCKEGYVKGRHSKTSCVPCPVGTYFNSSKQCESCQQGSYQDRAGSMACVSCQDGFTTLQDGTSDKKHCVEMCHLGFHSPTGVSPCSACPPGTYQSHEGGTSCITCPRGMRTKGKGAKFLLECIPFDVLFQGPVSVAMSSASHAAVCEFTLSVWVNVVASGRKGLILEVYHPKHGTQISIELGPIIKMELARDRIYIKKGLERKWSHVALVWSRRSVHVFKDGRQVWHRKRSCTRCPIPGQASMTIKMKKNSYALIQSLNVMPSTNISAISMLSKSCEAVLEKSLFSINGLNISSLDRVLEVTPSTCRQSEACKSKPCGEHHCVPTSTSFRCICKGGYSGDKCQDKPDFCRQNQCAYGSTCQSNMINGYQCHCPVNVTGMLCEETTVPPNWSEWSDWGECSKSCGSGFKVRRRFCSIPNQDGSTSCPGKDTQSNICKLANCPDCNQTDLIVGRGVSASCTQVGHNTTCSIKCDKGLVFSEEPVNYTCTLGEWSPDKLTQSCTVPHTPWTVGIKYSVVLHAELSVTDARQNLLKIGSSFGCVKARTCRHRVDVKNCDATSGMCKMYGGDRVGHLNLYKDVQPGSLNLSAVHQSRNEESYSSLFKTWQVLRHESTETSATPDTGRPGDRPLQIQVQGSESLIFPRDNRSKATRVGGEFGQILSAWHELDTANWEVRKNNYSAFKLGMPDRKAPYMVAEQHVTCPKGAVPGGLFCMKCAPGTYYKDEVCLSCPTGFYQDQQGMMECKSCPGFSTTSLVGASSPVSCKAPESSDQYLLMTSGQNNLTKIHLSSLRQETLTIPIPVGSIALHVHSPVDDFIYYSTQLPATIGRVKWDGSHHKVMMTLNADEVTGLAVDERSNIVFFTLYSGSLRALTSDLDTDILILGGLNKPRDLVTDQHKFTMYWTEGTRVMKYIYGRSKRTSVLSRDTAIWGLKLEEEANRLSWFARGKLYSTDTEVSGIDVAIQSASLFHGRVEDYHFYIDNENRLVRVNRDGVTKSRILSFKNAPKSVSISSDQERQWRHLLCKSGVNTCDGVCWQTGQLDTACLCSHDHAKDVHSSGTSCWKP